MAEPAREFEVGEHQVRVVGDETPPRPFRGFFSGDELPGEHHMAPAGPEGAEAAAEPSPDMVAIEVDGVRYEAHRVPSGWFHLHMLPFQRFKTVDEIVAEIIRLTDLGVLGGGA
jgi:hypothetical protein